MEVILDTNAISALAARDEALLARIRGAGQVAVTIISLGEYRYGMVSSRYQKELKAWFKAFLKRTEILYADLATVTHYGDIRLELKKAGTPIPANDCWIAAFVRQHRLPILSRDQHFDLVDGVTRVAW